MAGSTPPSRLARSQTVVMKFLQKHPSGLLLAAQVAAILFYPVMEETRAGQVGFVVFGNVVLALALWVEAGIKGRSSVLARAEEFAV